MKPSEYFSFDPLLSDAEANEVMRITERWGRFKTYAEEPVFDGLGEGLFARHDAAMNFVKTGGRLGRKEDLQTLARRTNYFRETYAYDGKASIEGIEPFLNHEGFIEAARQLFGRPIVRPSIVFANLLVPGQELAVHTDVPEFRGVNRTKNPQWLLVAMHHSGLFDHWRMPIATGVSWYGSAGGGEFAFYPEGPSAPPVALPVRHNTAILLDTDSTFHGVDRVAERNAGFPGLKPGLNLVYEGNDGWRVGDGDETVARYKWDDVRLSISWKAYCFADEAEERAWAEHSHDVTQDQIVERLVTDLRERGRIQGELPDQKELALTIIDEYIQFPPAAA